MNYSWNYTDATSVGDEKLVQKYLAIIIHSVHLIICLHSRNTGQMYIINDYYIIYIWYIIKL